MGNVLGLYDPAFFKMSVNVDGDIDLNNMSAKDFSVFFHEYIHFIQDFTTSAGCRKIYVIGEYLKQCVNNITSGGAFFDVPMDPCIEHNVLTNIDLLNRVEGDDKPISVLKIKSIELYPEKVIDEDGKQFNFNSVLLTTIGDDLVFLGTFAIKESMAYLVEQLCTTSYISSPDFPYNITRVISDYILGKDYLDNLYLLALCDVALLTSNPGFTFVNYLNLIRSGSLVLSSPEDIYNHFYSCNSYDYVNKKEVSAIQDFLISSKLALTTLKGYYNLPGLKDLNDWLDKVFSLGYDLRMDRSFIFLEMARGNKDQQNEILQSIAKKIGSPLMENNQGQMYKLKMSQGEPPTEYLYVLEQIYNLFDKGDKCCSLKNWCLKTPGVPPSPADARCDNEPWRRCRDKNLCPYALFWHHRGLSNFEPK